MRIFFLTIVLITFGFSHKLNLFLAQEDNSIYASAYFASGSACQNCELIIKDKDDNILEKTKTDTKGEYFIRKFSPTLTVSVNTKDGHGTTKSIVLEKFEQESEVFESKKIEKLQQELKDLKKQNQKLDAKVKLLEEKLSYNELFKMLFALLVIVGIFFVLKRVTKNA